MTAVLTESEHRTAYESELKKIESHKQRLESYCVRKVTKKLEEEAKKAQENAVFWANSGLGGNVKSNPQLNRVSAGKNGPWLTGRQQLEIDLAKVEAENDRFNHTVTIQFSCS